MVKLLRSFKTVAFLADAGCYDAAYSLLGTLDQIAMGLELYYHSCYQLARIVLIRYIETSVEAPGDWHSNC